MVEREREEQEGRRSSRIELCGFAVALRIKRLASRAHHRRRSSPPLNTCPPAY